MELTLIVVEAVVVYVRPLRAAVAWMVKVNVDDGAKELGAITKSTAATFATAYCHAERDTAAGDIYQTVLFTGTAVVPRIIAY